MSLTYVFFIYLLIWWVTLFMILPLGVERHTETGQGFDAGAPKFANLKKKLLLNTAVSGVILAVIWILVELDVIRWREWFDQGVTG
jgi:predicted secreted protein